MNMKNFLIRSLMLLTFVIGTMFICIIDDNTEIINMFAMFTFFVLLFGMCYFSVRNFTKAELNNLLGLTWLEKKTGLNFSEE